jgi:hypothetical protein
MMSGHGAPEWDSATGTAYVTNGEYSKNYVPEDAGGGAYSLARPPIGISVWHEAIAHGSLGTTHSPSKENAGDSRSPISTFTDPTVAEENKARACLKSTNWPSMRMRRPYYFNQRADMYMQK